MQGVQHGDQLQAEAVQAGEPVPSLQLRAARLLAGQGHVQEQRPAASYTGSLSIIPADLFLMSSMQGSRAKFSQLV